MATIVFARMDDARPVAESIQALLQDEAHQQDLSDFSELPEPLVICPPHQGWVAICGAASWFDDLTWLAQRLSERHQTEVAACEVFGSCFQLRLVEFVEGAERRRLVSPEREPGPADPMPLYDDVEQLAFDALRALGVPAPLIAVGSEPLGSDAEREPLGPGLTLLRQRDGQAERGERLVTLPRLGPGDDAPVIPMRISRDFGFMLFEDRYVEGMPGEAALGQLFALERALTQRAQRAWDKPDELSLTCSYFAGTHQERMDAMLQAHDRQTTISGRTNRPQWWAFWRYFGKWH